jgi:pimeloyl-ACP methyl ester carboxylesterase
MVAAMVPKDVSTRRARIRFVEAGAGPALLLVHDAIASHATYLASATKLAADFRVVAPDLPGFGASEKPDPQKYAYGYDAFADSLFDLVAALGLGRVHVVGHGMGAGVALTLAAKHPAVVHRLVLVDALVYPLDAEPALDRVGRVPLAGALLWRQVMGRALFGAYVGGAVYAGASRVPDGRVDALYEAFNAPAARQAAHATIVAKADSRPLVARLPRVNAETLVIWGRDDRLAPVEHGRRLARELRGRFEVLECGRCPPDEAPEAFAAAVTSFLEGAPSMRAPQARTVQTR